MQKKNKILLYLGIVALILIVMVIIGKSTGIIGGGDITKVSAEKITTRTIYQSVSANGKIQPEVEIKISSDVSGEIRELRVNEGDSVIVGQLLAVIDPELYQSALDRAEAALNNSRANLANSKARLYQAEARFKEIESQFSRNKKMHAQKLISDAEFETAQSTFAAAKADFESARQTVAASEFTVQSQEAGLKEARKNLSRTQIYAPVSGTISKLAVEKGERVVGTSQMAGTEMMRIANLNHMEVNVDVNENDIIRVSLGDSALIEVDAYNNRKFKGIVTEVSNSATSTAATTSDQVTNFVVKIRILRSSYQDLTDAFGSRRSVFRPGMSASVEIQTEMVEKAIAVPIESVTMKSISEFDSVTTNKKEEVESVFVLDGNKVLLKRITTGIQDDKFIEVKEGLKPDDEVVTGPYSSISRTLKTNQQVEKVSKESLFNSTKNE
jgi:HlyD family secretion protein